ncbi:ATP-binding protein [Novosphingobium barchaimii]|nr:ATP-binding protein [Novosphingobium barchaimii]
MTILSEDQDRAAPSFLTGGGEIGALMRAFDWSATPLGDPGTWPQSLRSIVSACINSPILGAVLWGQDLILLYNDAYIPALAGGHPHALGRPAGDGWGEAWTLLAPSYYRAMETGEGFSAKMVRLELVRNGEREVTWWDFTAAPIRGEDGAIAGLLHQGIEITAQVQAEGESASERDRLAQLFAQAPSFMALLEGPEHRFALANPAYLRLTGRSALVGQTVAQALPDAAAQGYVATLDEVFRSGKAYKADAALYAVEPVAGGPVTNHLVDFVFQPVKDANDVVTGIFVEGVDVTERVNADVALRESQERLEQALSAGEGIGTWDWDVAANFVRTDSRFARLYGVDPQMAQRGAPIELFFRRLHPADMDRVQAAIANALNSGCMFYEEYRLVQDNGAIVWLVAQGRCILSDAGEPLHFPGVSYDITERKTAEQRKSALLDLSDKLRSIGEIAEMEFAGATALALGLGVSRAGYGTVDKVLETITVQRDWNAPGIKTIAGTLNFREHGSYIENLKRGETVAIGDVRLDDRTHSTADVLEAISARSFINMPLVEQGDFVALAYVNNAGPRVWSNEDVFFMRDVAERVRGATERKRQTEELAQLNATLEEQVSVRTQELMAAEEALRQSQKMEAVGQLTGGIAHDFNNLLQGITGSLEIIQRRVEQGRHADISRFITGATTAANRAAALTHRLLAFSRRQPLDPKAVRSNKLLASVEDLLRRTIGEHIELELVLAGGLWPTLCDPNQLESAVLNLVINARDAMPDGGKLTIETGNAHLDQAYAARKSGVKPGQYVCISVTDTGTGMSKDTIAKAFEPFFTTKPIGQGTGLGLSMIYGFAQQSEGYAKIYSELGHGTTFKLYLPRHLGEAEWEEDIPALGDEHVSDSGEVVLVVEDESVVRDLIIEVLTELGYRAIEANDGPKGLQMLQSDKRIDLLITDIGLPGLNGRQVVEAGRLLRPDLKVLFMTGYAENAALASGFLEHGMSMITKPFAMEALATRVREIIEG